METSPNLTEAPHLELTQFRKLSQLMGQQALEGLLSTYFHDAHERIEKIAIAVRQEDAKAAERAAHALKGSSGMLGLSRMAAICNNAEIEAESGEVLRIADLLPKMRAELTELQQLMTSVVTHSPEGLRKQADAQ